ncbi:MAG: TolC family protein [Gammaproteobacteria bacterium]|nr:TolC family protein [Gammaproteobacteria bacterium]
MKTLYSRQRAVRVALLTLAIAFNSVSKAESVLDIAPLAVSDFVKNSLNQQPRLLAAQADIAAYSANLQASKQAIYNPELELAYENSSANTKTIGISQTLDWGDQQGSRTDLAGS